MARGGAWLWAGMCGRAGPGATRRVVGLCPEASGEVLTRLQGLVALGGEVSTPGCRLLSLERDGGSGAVDLDAGPALGRGVERPRGLDAYGDLGREVSTRVEVSGGIGGEVSTPGCRLPSLERGRWVVGCWGSGRRTRSGAQGPTHHAPTPPRLDAPRPRRRQGPTLPGPTPSTRSRPLHTDAARPHRGDGRHTGEAGQLGLGAPGRAYRIQVITMHNSAKATPIQ